MNHTDGNHTSGQRPCVPGAIRARKSAFAPFTIVCGRRQRPYRQYRRRRKKRKPMGTDIAILAEWYLCVRAKLAFSLFYFSYVVGLSSSFWKHCEYVVRLIVADGASQWYEKRRYSVCDCGTAWLQQCVAYARRRKIKGTVRGCLPKIPHMISFISLKYNFYSQDTL